MTESTRAQSYANHAHQPLWTYLAGVLGGTGFVLVTGDWLAGWHRGKLGVVLVSLAVLTLVSMSRVYTVSLQDRIIRLEMRLRLREVLPAAQQASIMEIPTPQLVALRFASDVELPALVERAIRERLSRKDIKKAVKDWVPDVERT